MRYHADLPRGFTKTKLRHMRKRYHLDDEIQIHHVIPKAMKQNEVLQTFNYDIEAPYNLIFLPNLHGSRTLSTSRLTHQNGHPAYNNYVHDALSNCESHSEFVLLLIILHKGIRGKYQIPWL